MIRTFAIAALLFSSATQAATITDVRVSGAGPVTFGQVFAVGDMKKSDVLVGKLDGVTVPLQVDIKATHADGSVRHAIISAIMPKAGTMQLNTGGATAANFAVVQTDIPAVVASATIGGVKYSASPSGAFKASWLQGPIANEWQTSAPLTTAAGVAHPHLSARFAIRYYGALKKARIDVTVENDWAYEPGPQNFTYNAEILVGGKSVYAKPALTHFHHARWRKLFWWGGDAPTVNVQLNTKYLIGSKAVPNFDQSFGVDEAVLNSMYARTQGGATEPMSVGLAAGYMPMTGGRDDIGILPVWAAAHVLTMDSRVRDATLLTGDSSGAWSMHYRDRKTDQPISLADFPYATIDGRSSDTLNPVTKQYDAFPSFAVDSPTPFTVDTAHHPGLAYLPYLVTGDLYYLEEMQFWAMYNIIKANPAYRQFGKGLLISEQVRGQAWGLRTLVEAAAFTPDMDPLKAGLVTLANNNFDWYNTEYSNNARANKLGAIINGFAISYSNVALAPWQDDFFTAAVGHAVELGFDRAAPLLAWKSKFPVQRMVGTGSCWALAAPYYLSVRDTETSPLYGTPAQGYVRDKPTIASLPCAGPEMAAARGTQVGDMGEISNGYMGYPSNMQPALAYAVDSGIDGSKRAWDLFMSRTVKPDYTQGAEFSIVPRSYVAAVLPALPGAPSPSVPSSPAAPASPAAVASAPTVPGTWSKIAAEGAAFTVPAGTFVRYGVGTSWIYSKDSGIGTNGYFGKDPALNTIKTVEAFTPAAPMLAIKATTGSNTKLAKQTGMTVVFLDPVKLSMVKSFTGVTATSKGAFTVSDVLLQPSAQYLVAVISSAGKPLDAFLLTVPK